MSQDDSVTLMDVRDAINEEHRVLMARSSWKFDTQNLVLRHKEHGYEVDLEDCLTSAGVLDWLAQLRPRETDKDFLDLFDVLNFLVRFQAHMCSFGKETMCGRNWARELYGMTEEEVLAACAMH